MLDRMKKLSALNGISGREDAVRDYLISCLPDYCTHSVDAAGNLLVQVQGKSKAKNRVMLAAHMDEVGLIVTYVTDDGLIRFTNVGGVETAVLLGRRVKVRRRGRREQAVGIGCPPNAHCNHHRAQTGYFLHSALLFFGVHRSRARKRQQTTTFQAGIIPHLCLFPQAEV